MYLLANYIPLTIRKRVARIKYRPRGNDIAPRDSRGYCPLGKALQLIAKESDGRPQYKTPDPRTVMYVLMVPGSPLSFEVELDIARFIHQWDLGLVTDLAAALGVEEQ